MKFLFKFAGILLFCAVSFYALFLAYGYQYDVVKKDIRKTSIIDLAVPEDSVEVLLNGKVRYMGNLPYQIKGIAPGTVQLLLKKKDFLPWKRTLRVKSDFVSKITDILFIPENIPKWIKELVSFADGAQVVAGDGFLVVTRPYQRYLTVIFLNDDGTFRQKEIPLRHENLLSVDVLYSGRLLAYFSDGAMEWIPLDEEKVAPIFGGKIPSDVADFVHTKNRIYYLRSGMLFSSNLEGKQVALLDQGFQNFYSVRAIEKKNYSFLIFQITPVAANNVSFSLYLVNHDSTLKLLTEDIFPEVFVNNLDQVLFSDFDKQLFLYDPRLDKKVLLRRSDGDFQLIGWFDDEHFLFRGSDGNVSVSDVSMSNVVPLLSGINRFEDILLFAKNRMLFYYSKNKLNVLNWQNG